LQICDDYVSSKERKVPDFVALLAHIGGNAELGANMRFSVRGTTLLRRAGAMLAGAALTVVGATMLAPDDALAACSPAPPART
jgi:hypothetical protein